MKSPAISAIIAAAAVLLPAASYAADETFCDEYASQALISATQNKTKQCGYNGPRWGFDYDTHYDWCLLVPEGAAMAERQGRKQDIQACFQNGSGGGGGPNKGKVFFLQGLRQSGGHRRQPERGAAVRLQRRALGLQLQSAFQLVHGRPQAVRHVRAFRP